MVPCWNKRLFCSLFCFLVFFSFFSFFSIFFVFSFFMEDVRYFISDLPLALSFVGLNCFIALSFVGLNCFMSQLLYHLEFSSSRPSRFPSFRLFSPFRFFAFILFFSSFTYPFTRLSDYCYVFTFSLSENFLPPPLNYEDP